MLRWDPLPEEGKALANLRAEVGMVFQSFNLFAHKTVLDNVALGPINVRKQSADEAKERARTAGPEPLPTTATEIDQIS